MKKVGYVRTSLTDDSIDSQKSILKDAGCSIIYKDIVPSSKAGRPGFDTLLESITEDDVIVVHSLDRLACSMNQLIDSVSKIQEKGAHIETLEDAVHTSKVVTISEVFLLLKSSKEKMFRERTKPGRVGAKARGRMGGRPEKISIKQKEEIKRLYNENIPVKSICERLNISRPTLYKYLRA